MEQARIQSKQTGPFLLTREYRMYHGDDPKPASQVKAQISVFPPHDRDFKIVETKGSDRGEKIVRKILEHEAAAEKANPSPTAVTSENYNFTYDGEAEFQGLRCHLLSLHPKRRDPSLLEGRVWVDAENYLIHKIEGEMSKSPSWWVRDVKVTLLFGEMGGIWTQTTTNAEAQVRVLGKYTVTAKALELEPESTVASNSRKARRWHSRRSLPAEVLPSVIMPR